MNALILYHSRSGHTQILASNIADILRENRHHTTCKSIIEVSQADVDQADVIFLGTWVHGLILFNVRPANAKLWVKSLPDLSGKSVATFCTYAFNPRDSLTRLNNMLKDRGATIIGSRAFQRSRLDSDIESYVVDALTSVSNYT